MKNRLFSILLLVAIGMIFLVNHTYAGTAYSDGRAYLRQGSPQNAGKVYVASNATEPAAGAYKTCNTVQTSESTAPSASAQVSGEKTKTTYHFWAQANAGYKFTGWYNSNGVLQGSGAEHISAAITSGQAGGSDTHAYLDMHASFIKIIQMSFVTPTNGSFTIMHNGAAVSNYATITVDGKVVLSALPADGYKLQGWYTTTNGGTTKNYFAFGTTCEPNFTNNVTIGADFVPDDGKATFWNKNLNKIYNNLNTANNAASSGHVIVAVSDGVLSSGTYTINAGVTLLIPYKEEYNLMTTPNVKHIASPSAADKTPTVFRKLTLASGAVINCSGNICIGGSLAAVNGGQPSSFPTGPVGMLDLSRGGTVNLESGAKLYAWGYVKGQDMDQGNNTTESGVGSIIAKSGSEVWEDYQVGEWRGGTASSTIYSNKGTWKFFPFQSYTIQNIEAPVTYNSGSVCKCYWAIFGNGSTYTVSFPLIASSDALFKLSSGATIKKWYDPTTDHVCFELGGAAALDALKLSVMGESVSSADYNLPIPANLKIILGSGNTLSLAKPMTVHAGAVVEVKSGATLNVNSKVYLYDKDDWDTYCMYAYYYRTYFSPSLHFNRGTGTTKDALVDATVIVDGTVNVANQMLYATQNGASIIGNGGGTFKYGTLPGNTTMTQCKVLSDNVSVNIRSANLKNDDESFTKGIASTTFKNINGRWFTNTAATKNKADKTYDFTYIKSGDVYGTGGTDVTVAACYSKDKTGLEIRDKWANIKKDACDDWWQGIDDGYLYNYTMSSAWHQFIKTSMTIGSGEEAIDVYSGSNNKLYTKTDCTISELGAIDANCLYTIDGVKKALIGGSFVQIEKNTDDEAYHKVGAATTYYISFDGCNWQPATKVSGKEKAYTVGGTVYIWYNNDWLAVQNDATVGLYYSLSSTNVKIYYDYVSSSWTLATPVAEVVTSAGTEQVYALATAVSKAAAGGTNVTIRLLKNISGTISYTAANNCSLDLNGFTLSSSTTSMITINNANATFIVKDQSSAGTGKIQAKYSRSDNKVYGLNITKGHLILNSGTVHIENTHASQGACGVVVKSGYKFTMNGGKLEVTSKGESWGINTESTTTSVVNINKGTIDVKTTSTSAAVSGIQSLGGQINVSGGTITASTTTSKTVKAVNLTNANSTLNITGGTVKASAPNTVYGVYVTAGSKADITGGTISGTTTAGTARGVISYGTTTISGGTITATAGSSDAKGVYVANNATTINAGVKINATAQSNAYGIYYADGTPTVTVNGGTFTVSTTSTTGAYGIYAAKGTGTVNDGTFNVTAQTTSAYGMSVETANTPKLTVNGGKFMVKNSNGSANGTINNTGATLANFTLAGGYYNIAPNGTANIAAGKLVKDLDATVEASLISAGYTKKIAGQEYTVTWKNFTGSKTLKTEKVESGKVPVWTGDRPDYKDATSERDWIGWATGTWNQGTQYVNGTALPAIVDQGVTYYAACQAIYADVTADGTTTRYNSAQAAWSAAMTKKQATIRILTNLGSEASVGNMTQLVFNPANDGSIITFDLNGHIWTMGNHATAANNKNVFLSVAPTKANCKLIITDNSSSGNGYLMNKHAYAGSLFCVSVANGGELILQGGGLRVSNTSDISAAKYGVGVDVASGGKFTMTGGTIYSTDVYSPRGLNVSGTADIAGGTIEANTTTGHAYAILSYGTVSVGGTAIIKAISTGAAAYAAQTQGTLNIDGGTIEATAAGNARALFAYLGGKITVDGNPTIKAEVTSGSEAYPVYSHTSPSELVINGGSFTSTGISTSGSIMGVRTVSNGVVTVNDGSFTINGGSNWSFGAFANGGTINLNGGNFTINQQTGGNVEAVRVYPNGTCNISGGTYTVNATANKTNGNALCAFGGTANITGNPVFTAYKGIDIATAVVANGDLSATVSVDGGTYITSSYALRSIKTTRDDSSLKGSITGDVTVWDGRFYSGSNQPINTSSGTSYLKIRGGYYSTYTSSNVSNLTQYVVSPSTAEAYATTIDGKAYTYRVNTKYNVTFSVNGTNTVKQYNRNETPDFGSTPSINDGNTYEFVGWSPEIAPVTTDVTYTAVFKKYEAEVIIPGAATSKRYEHLTDAWTDALQIQTATVRLLSDVSQSTQLTYNPAPPSGSVEGDLEYFTNAVTTLDLNNHTLAYTGTADKFITVNKTGSTLTVVDNSASKGGSIDASISYNGALNCVYVLKGELQLESGKIAVLNKASNQVSRAALVSTDAILTISGGTLQAKASKDARAINSDGNCTVNITGGNIIAKSEYPEGTWGAGAYGAVMWNNGTINVSGTAVFTIEAASSATGIYAYGANGKFIVEGGTINATTKTGGTARCLLTSTNGTGVINGGTFNARTQTTMAIAAYADTNGKLTINGGTFDAQNALGNTSSIWNIEGLRVAAGANVTVNGGTFTASVGASPMAVGIRGGTTTINGGTFNSTRGLFAMDYADGTQKATVTINGGTFIGTAEAVRVASANRDVTTGETTTTLKAYSNVTVNGGYFYSTGSSIISLNQVTNGTASTLVLNGGKYCEKSGTTYKTQINNRKGATTTITDINETVDGRKYVYELKTPFTVTWNAGTSYTKTEQVQSGTTPANTECKSFVATDGKTYYFTNWTPTPTPVYGDVTYEAEGTYYEAKVKIGTGAWTNYTDFLDAWNVVQNSTNATTYITLLNNVELSDKILHKPAATKSKTEFDLNNFTLSVGGTVDRLLEFNKADATLTITDNSTDKGGTLSIIRTSATNVYNTCVHSGELKMTGGRLYVENNQNDANWHPALAVYVAGSDNAKLTMTDGTLESKAKYCAYTVQSYGITNITGGTVKANSPGLDNGSNGYAVCVYAVQRTTTIGGTAHIEATGLMNINGASATGWVSNDGKTRLNGTLNITGGTIDVTATSKNAYGMQAYGTAKLVDETYYGAHGIINVSGGTVNVKCSATTATQVFAAQSVASRYFDTETPHHLIFEENPEVNISGGTFLVDTRNNGAWVTNGGNVDLLRNWGVLNVSGGTFTIYQKTSPVGVASYRNKATVSGNPVFNINGATSARGVVAGPWNSDNYCDADASKNLAEVEVNGGTFNVTTTTSGDLTLGAWAYGALDGNSKYAMNAKVTVNGGEFICINPTANNSRIFRQEHTRTGTYGSATAQIIVNGGKFKPLFGTAEPYASTGTHNVTLPNNNDKRTVLTGGYYVHDTELATFKADTCVVTPINSASDDAEYDNGYRYKIETNYVAQVKVGSTVKKYTYIKDAFDYFKTVNNATLTVLNDCNFDMGSTYYNLSPTISNWVGTLDLNNHTINAITTADRFFNCNSSNVKTFTITDSSTDKGGKFYYESAYSTGTTYGFLFYRGTFNLQAGTLHLKKTVAAGALAVRIGDGAFDAATPFNMTGGKIICESGASATGIADYGKTTISGGEVEVICSGATSYGITVAKNNTSTTTLDISGTAKISAKGSSDIRTINMSSLNTTNITGGTIIAKSTTTSARGILATAGTLNISGSPVINDTTTTAGARGIYVNGDATVNISGSPTINSVATTTEALGIDQAAGTVTISGTPNISAKATEDLRALQVGGSAVMTVNSGTFNATATTKANINGIRVTGAAPDVTIKGGTFNVTSGIGDHIYGINAQSVTGAGNVKVQGGTFIVTTGTSSTNTCGNVEGIRMWYCLNTTINVSGGSFTLTNNGKYKDTYAIRTFDGTVNITGTPVFNAYYGIYLANVYVSNTTTTVNVGGGTFNTTSYALRAHKSVSSADANKINNSKIVVAGGYFKSTNGPIADVVNGATLTLQGGFYNEKSGTTFKAQLANYVSDPYEVFVLEDGDANKTAGYAYEVCQKRVAKVEAGSTRTYYTDLKAAIDYAKAQTVSTTPRITVLKDNTPSAAISFNPSNTNMVATLDLNGCETSFVGTNTSPLITVSAGKMIVTDGTTDGEGMLKKTGANAHICVQVAGGTMDLQAGTIYSDRTGNATYTVRVSGTGNFTMSGGKIEGHSNNVTSALNVYTTATVSGGEIEAYGATGANGIQLVSNDASSPSTTVTVSGSPQIKAEVTTQNAYALCATKGSTIINGTPTFTASGPRNSRAISASTAGTLVTVNGGEYKAEITSGSTYTDTYVICVEQTSSVTVNGGKFQTNTSNFFNGGIKGTLAINGGYFNEYSTGTSHKDKVEQYCVSPKHAVEMTAADKESIGSDYSWKVVEAYNLTWTTDGNALTGDYTKGITAVGLSIVRPDTPTKVGYTFKAWSPSPASKMPAADTEYAATWNANTNTAYTVKHMREALDGTYPASLTETENLTGTTAANVTPAVKTTADYTGFTAPATQTKAILADGSLVIEYKYTRNSYALTWNLDGGKVMVAGTGAAVNATGSPSSSVKFGATITAPTVTRDGYHFDGWNETPTSTMPAEDKTYTAQWTIYVASVKIGTGTPTYHTTLADAFAKAKTGDNAVITVLADVTNLTSTLVYDPGSAYKCTLDLNSHHVKGAVTTANGSSYNQLLRISKTSSTFTITDNSTSGGGKLHQEASLDDALYGVYVNYGHLKVEGGTIYCKNTNTSGDSRYTYGIATRQNSKATNVQLTVSGGKVSVESNYRAYALVNPCTSIISGGTIEAKATGSSGNARGIYTYANTTTITGNPIFNVDAYINAYGIFVAGTTDKSNGTAYYGIVKVQGGTFNVNTTTKKSAFGACADGHKRTISGTNYGAYGTLEIEGGTFNVVSHTSNAYGVYVGRQVVYNLSSEGTPSSVAFEAKGVATVSGGTFDVKTDDVIAEGATSATGTNYAYGVFSNGTTTVSGGNFTVKSNTTNAYGVQVHSGKTTVSGSPIFKVTAGTTNAFGVRAGETPNSDTGLTYDGEAEISGGTFTVTSTGANSYGVMSVAAKRQVNKANYYGNYVSGGKITISGGTFTVTGTETVYGLFANGVATQAAAELNGYTYPAVSKGSKMIVTGGKFSANIAEGSSKTTKYAVNTSATVDNLLMQGGWYNINTNLANYIAPKKTTSNYYEFPLTGESPYLYEVAEGYTLTWVTDGDELTGAYTKGVTKVGTAIVTPDTPTKTGYTFNGWNATPAATMPAANTTYTAQWSVNGYKITWVDEDGTQLKVDDVNYGATPSYGSDPTKADDEDYSYAFAGWTPNVTAVTGDKTYTATYTPTERFYGETYKLDIIDWSANGASQSIKINMNQYLVPTGKTQWTVAVNGDKYKNATASRVWDDADHALTISGLTLTAGAELVIKTYDGATDEAECISRLKYKVPEIITANKTVTAAASDVIYVRSGNLTVNGNISASRVYVNPGAILTINSTKTLTVTDRMVLRTQAQQNVYYDAPELVNNGTLTLSGSAKMYYSRIVSDNSQAYQIGFPYSTDLTQTTFSNGKTATKGSHYGILYYDSQSRADNGMGGNWKTFETTTLQAKQGYQIISASQYYYEILFPVTYAKVNNGATISVTAYGDANTPDGDKGWNYIVHPYTATFNCGYSDPSENIKVNILDADNQSFAQDVATALQPATPFYYQAKESGTLVFDNSNFRKQMFARSPQQSSSTQWVRLMFSQETGEANTPRDVTNLYFSPDKFSPKYDLGYDVVKLSKTANRPLLWTSLSYGDMAFTALPDSVAEQLIPLTTFTKEATEYTFYLEETEYLNRVDKVMLYDIETGSQTDLLFNDYTTYLESTTSKSRFFLNIVFKAPSVATDLENHESGALTGDDGQDINAVPRKEFIDGILYIIMPDGTRYNAVGARVK